MIDDNYCKTQAACLSTYAWVHTHYRYFTEIESVKSNENNVSKWMIFGYPEMNLRSKLKA